MVTLIIRIIFSNRNDLNHCSKPAKEDNRSQLQLAIYSLGGSSQNRVVIKPFDVVNNHPLCPLMLFIKPFDVVNNHPLCPLMLFIRPFDVLKTIHYPFDVEIIILDHRGY